MPIPGSTLERSNFPTQPAGGEFGGGQPSIPNRNGVIEYDTYQTPFQPPASMLSPVDSRVLQRGDQPTDFLREQNEPIWPTFDEDLQRQTLPPQELTGKHEGPIDYLRLHGLKLSNPKAAAQAYNSLPKSEQTAFDRFEVREWSEMSLTLGAATLDALGIPRPKNIWVTVPPHSPLDRSSDAYTVSESAPQSSQPQSQQSRSAESLGFHAVAPGTPRDEFDALVKRPGVIGRLRNRFRTRR